MKGALVIGFIHHDVWMAVIVRDNQTVTFGDECWKVAIIVFFERLVWSAST